MTGQLPALDVVGAPGCALLVLAPPGAAGHVKLMALGLKPDLVLKAATESVRWIYGFSGDGAVATARFQAKEAALDFANALIVAESRKGGRASVHIPWPDTCLVFLGGHGPTATLSLLSDALVDLLTSPEGFIETEPEPGFLETVASDHTKPSLTVCFERKSVAFAVALLWPRRREFGRRLRNKGRSTDLVSGSRRLSSQNVYICFQESPLNVPRSKRGALRLETRRAQIRIPRDFTRLSQMRRVSPNLGHPGDLSRGGRSNLLRHHRLR